jgi:dTDP-4-dehydrorhamnose reductase
LAAITNSFISSEDEVVPKTAVIGAAGFIGRAMLAAYRRIHPDCPGTSRRREDGDLLHLDLSTPDSGRLRLRERGCEAAILLAAEPSISRCAADPDRAHRINVTGTLAVIDQLLAAGIQPIFTSSDYVFDGMAGGYSEDDQANPNTVYGRHKLAVERALMERSNGKALILRLSKIYSLQKGDGVLLDEMAQRFVRGEVVRAARDQKFSPLCIEDLVKIVLELQARAVTGIVHICGDQAWPRLHMARALAEAMGTPDHLLAPISLDDLEGPRRPKNTSMSNALLRSWYQRPLIDVPTYVRNVAANYANEEAAWHQKSHFSI